MSNRDSNDWTRMRKGGWWLRRGPRFDAMRYWHQFSDFARFPGLQYFAGRPRGAEAALLGLRTLQGSGFRLEAGFYGFTMVFVGVCLGLYGFPWVSLALLHGGFGHARCRRSCDNILHSGFGPGLPLAFRFPALFVKLKVPK
ncbi:unnamed protein product [Symbiodinium natans]|uniref:Uncharacterized protein n=1 Tax=Symbiodinium natans TaxID=878477 RepID=A0A812QRD7_9DINO|nr:unnamed protein product [Symbiodinium natans]